MSTRAQLFMIVAVLPVTAAVAMFMGLGPAEPSERDLRFWFKRNRGAFERVRALLDQGPHVFSLDVETGYGHIDGRKPGDVDWREPRVDEMRSLMRWIGTNSVNAGAHGGLLWSWVHAGGFRGGAIKGYAFGRTERGVIVASVDVRERDRYFHAGAQKIYSQLADDWFVFYDFGD